MNFPIDVTAHGAVILGDDVVCDGFVDGPDIRVQSHVHTDHLHGFDSSKGKQVVLATPGTHALLCSQRNADLPYRVNFRAIDPDDRFDHDNCRVSLVPNGHMLGAAQVVVEFPSGTRVGYSGDFPWPCEQPIAVDALVLDATYGSPGSVRNYTQGEAEDRLLELLTALVSDGPVYMYAHEGTLQRALQLVSGALDCPIVASEQLQTQVDVYREFGFPITDIVLLEEPETADIIASRRFIRVFGRGDQLPADPGHASVVTLSAYFARPDDPVIEYSERAYGVALSNHADFYGTLEYVEATGAQCVITDNSRSGRGIQLALEIKARLGVEAAPSSNRGSRAWGSG